MYVNYPKEIELQAKIVIKIIAKHKTRQHRIIAMRRQGFKVIECGYMRNASKKGDVEYFPRKKEYRIAISRPSEHLCRQFDYVRIKC